MTKANVTVTARRAGDSICVLDVKGQVTACAENALMDAYTEATSGNASVIILNFDGLEHMDSNGIGLLVTLLIRAKRRKQQLLACGLSERYRDIFELARLSEAAGVYSTEAEALAAVQLATR